ncbi:MerR family transcriptional regulator [Quadrisphaera granulorum]|nr:MerR family transcriptional regulator [Quadrisphaera granulorum]
MTTTSERTTPQLGATSEMSSAVGSSDVEELLGIAQIAAISGLSQDTLRWYERQGLLPQVPRGSDGRRRYSPRHAAMVVLLARLRATGMPVEEMRAFSTLVSAGAATHGRRLALLQRHEERIHQRQNELQQALDLVRAKAAHYRELIAAGLDCDGAPVDADTAVQQARGTP